ncbi:MAG: response regulator transcription factor [Pseudomonadota bacterium]
MTTEKTILLVDDDPNILQVAGFAVGKAGYRTITAKDGKQALEQFRAEQPDLIVLDIVMPEMDGVDVCRQIRAESNVPVIFLSSMDDEVDRVVGLELGADDYLTKPFSPRELVARIRAVLRRSESRNEPACSVAIGRDQRRLLVHGDVRLDLDCFRAFWKGREVQLTATEFGIMKVLLSYPGKVFSRDQLMTGSGELATFVSDRTIDSHIRHIRDKFRKAGGEPIETVHSVGYKVTDAKS